MTDNESRPNADELTQQLTADFFEGRITLEQFRERLKEDAERQIDLDMLRSFCDAHEELLQAYSAMLQTIVEIATDQRDPDAWQWRETEVDGHVHRMTGKLPLWREQVVTVYNFLTALRAGSGQGPVRLHTFSHSTAHFLALTIIEYAAQLWERCKVTAHRSRTDPRYLYATTASALFFSAQMSSLPTPNELMGLLDLERAAATKALREGQRPHRTDAANGINIRAEKVNVMGQSVSIVAEQVAMNAAMREQTRAKRGKAGREKWRQAQDRMMERLRQGTLPKSLRDAAKAIEQTYDTTRRAAHRSDALRVHFDLQDEKGSHTSSNLLDELAKQADRRIQQAISKLTPNRRQAAEDALRQMKPTQRLELLRTLAADPDAGSAGDVSLIENADQDNRTDDDWSG